VKQGEMRGSERARIGGRGGGRQREPGRKGGASERASEREKRKREERREKREIGCGKRGVGTGPGGSWFELCSELLHHTVAYSLLHPQEHFHEENLP
jgi:hypothetical protein